MTNWADLLKTLAANNALGNPRLRRAFGIIDRAKFVRPDDGLYAYEDHPLSIGWGATISQPYTLAFMLDRLAPEVGDRVLDIGAGSGWSTALLAATIGPRGRVWGVEVVPELAAFGQQNLKKYPKLPAEILPTGKSLGLPAKAPFDRILVSAALPLGSAVPPELLDQLAPGGRMIIPIGYSLWQIDKSRNGKTRTKEFPGFIFVPLQNC